LQAQSAAAQDTMGGVGVRFFCYRWREKGQRVPTRHADKYKEGLAIIALGSLIASPPNHEDEPS
jgi:hypothetical protein